MTSAGPPGGKGSAGGRRRCVVSDRQAQRKFKHAPSFGVPGAYSPARAEQFRMAILRFVNDPATIATRGTYNRGPGAGGFPVDFYHDPGSRLVVVVNLSGESVTGFRMSAQQYSAFLRTHRLGGEA